VFRCRSCGLVLDHDENAARNLAWYGQFGRNQRACGESSVGGTAIGRSTRHGSVKQEADATYPLRDTWVSSVERLAILEAEHRTKVI